MRTRRAFLLSGTAALAAPLVLSACGDAGDSEYTRAVEDTWHPAATIPDSVIARQRELVHYATLAPSSHNTQCWRFKLGDDHIAVLPDLSRRCPAVDPDDHHLYVSLGCATENLVLAASASGLHAELAFDPEGDRIKLGFSPSQPASSALFEAIPHRQCSRSEYDGAAVSSSDRDRLEQAGSGDGVRVLMFDGRARVEPILEYITRGNSLQIADPAFVHELKSWIRFNAADALASRDGLFTLSTGNPAVPHWLGAAFMSFAFTARSENDKIARQLRSATGIAVFVSETDDKAHWIEAGRCYERFALQATALGIRNALLNQPVEVAAVRQQFAEYLGLTSGRPDLIARFGYGPEMPRSLRRSIDAVLA